MNCIGIPAVQQPIDLLPGKKVSPTPILRSAQYVLSQSQNPHIHSRMRALVESSNIASYIAGDNDTPPFRLGEVSQLKKQVASLMTTNYLTYSIGTIAMKTMSLGQSYLEYFHMIRKSESPIRIPGSDWLLPSASLYGKLQECYALTQTLTQNCGIDIYLQSIKLMGCLSSTILCMTHLIGYLSVYRLPAAVSLSLTTLNYLTSLYETIAHEYALHPTLLHPIDQPMNVGNYVL